MRGLISVLVLVCLGILLLGTDVAYGQTRQIVAWGANDCGQCTIPVPNTNFVAVAGGNAHSLGLQSDGKIVAWGYNECGQCNVPSPNGDFVAGAAGGNHSLGLKSDGTIVAWGCNDFGQCNVPAPNADFVAVAGGDTHSLGLKTDGTIVAWGANDFGQCNVPAPNADFAVLGAGWYHSLALKSDGMIVAWGYNGDGQCNVPSPNGDFVALTGGGAHSLGLKSDGTIVAWGDVAAGQCNVPAPNEGFVAVAAGNAHSLGLKSDGTIVAWGANDYGQCNVASPNAEFVTVTGGAVHSLGVRSVAKLFVNQAATGANDGSSWVDAYADLQSALVPAVSGTSLWVAAGTYKPTTGSDRTAAFQLKDGVALYGGFDGTETTLEERDWLANPTVLSGDIGVEADSTDNSYHVVIGSDSDSTAVLDGFIVTAGRGDGGYPGNAGGGMYNNIGSPTISNLTFSRNSSGLGGGVYNCCSGHPVFTNVTFSQNYADSGGGIFNYDTASPTLTNVTFWGNVANNGGGMYNDQWGNPTLTNVTFSGNVAGSFGGAIYNDTSFPTLVNTVLWGDSAASGGNEICDTLASSPVIFYSIIEGCGGSGNWNLSFGTDGGHNEDADPLFVDQSGGNFRLNRLSPAVNAGDNFAPNLRGTDLDGNPRIVGEIVDMGAYEYQGSMGPVIYVDHSATGNNNGSSWPDAYSDLQSALSAAGSGDSIWVAAGTYKPTTGSNRTATFQLENGVVLYGGFAGTETVLGQRNWVANVTILSGDIGVVGVNTDNSYHVVVGSGTDSTAVLDGFAVNAGEAVGTHPNDSGGGVFNDSGSPTLVNVVFSGNTAGAGGGGMYNRNSNPALTNVTFSGNTADAGGGVYNYWYSSPTLVNAVFTANSGGTDGGAMENDNNCHPTLINVVFSGNSVSGKGGGVFNAYSSNPMLVNTIFWGDSATTAGDEICNEDGSAPVISYSLIEGSGGSASWNPSFGTDEGHNIDADPLFVDATAGNLRLNSPYSPAVNAGNNAALPLGVTADVDGNPRIVGDAVDMGAYEFQVLTAIESDNRPQLLRIVSVAPNPFNPSTTIRFTLPAAMPVTAEVWSVTGARVRVLAKGQAFGPGDNQLIWDGRNDHGSPVASGVYVIRVETRLGAMVTRAVLLK